MAELAGSEALKKATGRTGRAGGRWTSPSSGLAKAANDGQDRGAEEGTGQIRGGGSARTLHGPRRWTYGTRWDDLDVENRRRVVQALPEQIEVGPAVRGRNFYWPERVKVAYR